MQNEIRLCDEKWEAENAEIKNDINILKSGYVEIIPTFDLYTGKYITANGALSSNEKFNISDEELLSKTKNQISNDIWSYVNKQTAQASQTASNTASEQATQEAVNKLVVALKMDTSEGKTYTLEQVVAEASRIRTAYSKSCQDLSDMSASHSTATEDMQETISALRNQITELGEKPCK